jgi:hypothetical protein
MYISNDMRVLLLAMMMSTTTLFSAIVQIQDFLCGCEYCVTVNTSEPLQVGRHMIMCHSWRESTMKTFQIMQEMKQQKLNNEKGIPIEETLPNIDIPQRDDPPIVKSEPQTIHNDYQWRVHEDHGWTYSTTSQHTLNIEGWLYREDLKWVWLFGDDREFMYSVGHGWFYSLNHNNHRLLYWYDRRYWLLASDFWWKK